MGGRERDLFLMDLLIYLAYYEIYECILDYIGAFFYWIWDCKDRCAIVFGGIDR